MTPGLDGGALAAIIASVGEGIIAVDREGALTLCNAAAERLLGIRALPQGGGSPEGGPQVRVCPPPGQWSEVYGLRLPDLVTPLPNESLPLVRALQGEATDDVVLFVENELVQGMALSVSGRPIRDERGALLGAVMVCRDITAQVRAEAEQKKVTAFLDSIVENVPAMIFVKNAEDLRLELINRAGEELLGWPREQLVGKSSDELFPREQADFFNGRDLEALRSGRMVETPEEPIRTRHGDLWLRTLKIPIAVDHGKPRYLLGIGIDITAQKRAVEELRHAKELLEENAVQLRESEHRFRSFTETASDAIIAIDAGGHVVYWNESACRVFGYDESEALGVLLAQLIVPERYRDAHGSALASFEPGRPSKIVGKAVGVEAKRKDGTELPVELSVGTWANGEGERFFTAIVRDVSERKALERMKNEFVSTVSHELRTPLTSVRGALGLLEAGVPVALPAEAREVVQIARSNCDRLIRLINDILDLEKMEGGKLELHVGDVEPGALLAATADGLRGLAAQGEVTLVVLPTSARAVRADFDRAIQVLTNLAANAIKFSPSSSTIVLRAVASGANVRFSVSDHGPGIAEADRVRIFTKFLQLDASDARRRGGTGLGLAISKALVEQHGGQIGVESTVGEGSTFWFDLPLARRAARPRAGSILIVDDDSALTRVLALTLEHEGYATVHASTLAEATAFARAEVPAAVVLDVLLPDGNGLDLIARLREREATQRVPIIVLSGRERESFGSPLLVDWINKPFDPERLLNALQAAGVRHRRLPKVLVVEDDPSVRTILTRQLEALGARVLEAVDGAQAIELTRAEAPDLIVLDIGIPRPDGFEVVDILRGESSRSTPLIVYTARDLSATEREALILGMTRYFTKARVTEEQLVDAIRELLGAFA